MSLKLPQGQKLLTNVSVVRIKKGKDKFEIATYPNTVIAWRTGAEKVSWHYVNSARMLARGRST